jgi:hypothetical protein
MELSYRSFVIDETGKISVGGTHTTIYSEQYSELLINNIMSTIDKISKDKNYKNRYSSIKNNSIHANMLRYINNGDIRSLLDMISYDDIYAVTSKMGFLNGIYDMDVLSLRIYCDIKKDILDSHVSALLEIIKNNRINMVAVEKMCDNKVYSYFIDL